ncbi:dihydroxyacetone kinase subunit DhaK [Pseudokineococcus lusitanus]|uniref:Homodimeric dihydroxyacetone kinase n=1 Tax=Pseudokineococcus lusitanus TaxID=763993 RepID=A0A3N1GWP1_9ACTN|nr:dihydroxyacetone kinase subunit DhaK [Pseudokineococcus lusitanus]ROP34629.1 homodimeric dihydroxyacetone kinase [Pseudokineococcus lusitanus]
MSAPFVHPAHEPVARAAAGFARAHADLVALRPEPLHLLARTRHEGRRTGLVSGGGAGHEPLHVGLLGPGLLDGAAPGLVFTSPHNRQVLEAGRSAAGPEGVVLVVKNYTGDVVNFRIAAERLRLEGVRVGEVLVDDDLATDSADNAAGRRGTAATVVVEKLLGAAADEGRGVDDLADLGARVAAASRSLAVASRAQTDPTTGEPAFALGPDELELGVGIHGERAERTVARPPLPDLVDDLVGQVLDALPAGGGDGLLVVVNGLGATTQLELYAVLEEVAEALGRRGAAVADALVGTYVAALDMHGFSVTLTALEPGWLDLWRAPSSSAALTRGSAPVVDAPWVGGGATAPAAAGGTDGAPAADGSVPEGASAPERTLRRWAGDVETAHGDLTRLDRLAGDGDFGDNVRGGLRRVVARLDADGPASRRSGADALAAAGEVFLDEVGGTSGPMVGLMLAELAAAAERAGGETAADDAAWRDGLRAGLAAVRRVGGAEPGDRTLVDALDPAVRALADGGSLADAAAAAAAGADATARVRARRGRAAYLGDRVVGTPDPGAVAMAMLLRAAAGDAGPGDAVAGLLAAGR